MSGLIVFDTAPFAHGDSRRDPHENQFKEKDLPLLRFVLHFFFFTMQSVRSSHPAVLSRHTLFATYRESRSQVTFTETSVKNHMLYVPIGLHRIFPSSISEVISNLLYIDDFRRHDSLVSRTEPMWDSTLPSPRKP